MSIGIFNAATVHESGIHFIMFNKYLCATPLTLEAFTGGEKIMLN